MKICKEKNCQTPTTPDSARGWCTKHYLRWRRYGNINTTKAARHGMFGTPTHNSWANMRRRCLDPNSNRYKHYGGRGIKICSRWLDRVHGFKNFLKDMGERPSRLTLDRIDNDGNYEPGNCRWATYSEQTLNQRKRSRVLI